MKMDMIHIEKFEGDWQGYQRTIWIGEDQEGGFYMTFNLDGSIDNTTLSSGLSAEWKGITAGMRDLVKEDLVSIGVVLKKVSLVENSLDFITKYKGEIDGEFHSVWVAVDSDNKIYETENLCYKDVNGRPSPAIEQTEWKSISYERLSRIEDVLTVIYKLNFQPKIKNKMETQSVVKTADEIKDLFGNYEKLIFTIGKEENIKRKDNWLTTGGYVYHSESKDTILIPSINLNRADLISKFEHALAEGNKKFTVAVKLGEIKETPGEGDKVFRNIPVFVNDIEKYEKTIDVVGSVTKIEEKENSTKYVLLLPKVDGQADKFQELTITKSNEGVAKDVNLEKGSTVAVRGTLVTSWTTNGNLRNTVFPKVIKSSLKELEAHKESAKETVKKKSSMKVS